MREIVFSKSAAYKLDNLLQYLEKEWSKNVKLTFIHKLDKAIHQIQKYPASFGNSGFRPDLYRYIITKQTTLYYTFNDKKIYIVTLFDNRMNPEKLITIQ